MILKQSESVASTLVGHLNIKLEKRGEKKLGTETVSSTVFLVLLTSELRSAYSKTLVTVF